MSAPNQGVADEKPLPKEWYLRAIEKSRRRRKRKRMAVEALYDESVDLRSLSQHMRRQRVQPIRAIVLWASGADRDLLKLRPIETTEFVIQGVGVLIPTSMAFVAAFAASGFVSDPAPSMPARLLISFIFSALILAFDRSIVSQQLIPYQFSREILNALYDPTADIKWYDLLVGRATASGWWSRTKALLALPFKLAIRFAFSILSSLIVADVLVIMMFLPAVDEQAGVLLDQRVQSEKVAIETAYNDKLEKLGDRETAALDAFNADPRISQITGDIEELRKEIEDLNKEINALLTYAAAERAGEPGIPYPGGGDWVSSGFPRCLDRCQAAESEAARKTTQRDNQQDTLDDKTDELAALQGRGPDGGTPAPGSPAERLKKVQDLIEEEKVAASEEYYAALEELGKRQTEPVGILIRREALHQLSMLTEPWAPYSSPTLEACNPGVWRIPCTIWQALFPATPLGGFIGPIRIMLIIIDTAAVWFKLFSSLRRRRPYDALIAAIEEADIADSVNRLDLTLNEVGEIIEMRAATRRGARGVAGAEYLRQVREQSTRERRRLMRQVRQEVLREQEHRKSLNWRELLLFWRAPPERSASSEPSTEASRSENDREEPPNVFLPTDTPESRRT